MFSKKIICVLVSLLCLAGLALAKDVPFGPQREISISEGPAREVTYADVDGDGDLDLVAASGVNAPSGAYWYENLDGEGTFSAARTIGDCNQAPSLCNAFLPEMVDMDGDGDLDAVTGNLALVGWYENVDGAGNFGPQQAIRFDSGVAHWDVEVGDLDRDGDPDVVAISRNGNKVAWYENLGGGTFAGPGVSEILIGTGLPFARGLKLGDVNGDGLLDVLVASGGDSSISWFANLGGTFGPRQLVSVTTTGAYDVDVADVNGDGRLDVVSVADSNNFSGVVRWYDNVNGDGSSWNETIAFSTPGGYTQRVRVADLDDDGDPDLLTSSFQDSGRVVWYENLNGGAAWSERVISTDVRRASEVVAADLDGDGDLDVASASWGPSPAGSSPSDEKLAWYENRTIHRSAAYPNRLDVTTVSSAFATDPIAAADFDRDGDLDLALGITDDINRLFLNNGMPDAWTGVTGLDITADAQTTRRVVVGDFDGDGLEDFISVNQRFAPAPVSRLYLNNGTPNPFNGVTGLDLNTGIQVFAMDGGDLDNDGDLDLVYYEGALRVLLNNGTADPFNGVFPLSHAAAGTDRLRLADLDGDGDLDVVKSGAGTSIMLNNGTADPFAAVSESLLGTTNDARRDSAVGDLDGDGDLDVVACGVTPTTMEWFRNNGTSNPFNGVTQIPIAATDSQTSFVNLGDVDDDGDLDLVRTGFFTRPEVYLNNGTSDPFNGVTGVAMGGLGAPANDARDLLVEDVDGDGKLDVITSNTGLNGGAEKGVKWFRNTGGQYRILWQDAAGGEVYEGEESPLMAITLELLGRSGDPVGRADTMELNFRDAAPLTTAQAAALFSEVRIYRDNGDGVFDGSSDTLITAEAPNLAGGIQTVQLPPNDSNTRFAAPATFFVVAAMMPTASAAPVTTFQVDYLTSSRVVDTLAGILLDSENGPGVLTVPPVVTLGRFVVDSTNDEDDTNPGDGICTGISGFCTLRAAVEEANLRPGDDLIVVPSGLGPYVLTGLLQISDQTGGLTVRGDGPGQTVIDGGGVDRVFAISSGASAIIESLTVTNGSLASNVAGAGIANSGTLTVDDCEITSNTGGNGAGVSGASNSLTTIRNSTISNNTSLASGGGLAVFTGSTLVLEDSAVIGNTATSVGGAIFVFFDGVIHLKNSTVSQNNNPLTGSAAIVGDSSAGVGSSIDGLTITGNSNGGLAWYGPAITVRNTLVAANGTDITGPLNITSLGNNLIGNRGTNTAFVNNVNNDQVGDPGSPIDPLLAPLGDYGGPTLSHALEAGSPGIDAGFCPNLVTDQRGERRPLDVPAIPNVTDGCDIGAYEARLGQTEARLEVPVRWCAVRGAPSVEDPGLLGAATVDDLLRARHERASESIYVPQGSIAFRSAANFIVESFPVLEDPDCTESSPGSGIFNCTHGQRGDVYVNPEEANFFEFQQLIASCREAWQAQDPEITGITAVHINRFVDENGTPLELLGLGGRAEPGDLAEQSAAGRLMLVDNFYRQNLPGNPNPPNPEDLIERLFGHEMGHALSLRHGDGIDNDQDGILDNNDEKSTGKPRFDGPNLMQYRSGSDLTTEQITQVRSHIVFAVPDVVVQPAVDSLTNATPIDDERARILEFGYSEVVDLERARILEFAEGSPLDFERARILEFERARLLEFERARILEFENARILEFGLTYTGETSTDSSILVASTGSLPWPSPIRPTTSYYYYLDLDRNDATGGYPANSANPGDPGNNFPGTDVVQNGGDITAEAGVDLISEIVLESTCPNDVCTSTATLKAYDYNDTTGQYELVFTDADPTITAKGVGLYIDNGGELVDLEDAPIGMTLQPRIPNSVLFNAGWGFTPDPGSGAMVPDRIRMEVVSTIECDGRVLNDDLSSALVDCDCTDCTICPDYPGCVGPVGTPVTLTGTRIPTDAKAGELNFLPPVLPQATVSPLLAEEGQSVNVFITDLPTDIVNGTVEVTLNGVVLATAPTSSIAQDGSITLPVILPLGMYGDQTLSVGITGFAPRANAVVNVTPVLACPDNDNDTLCDAADPDDDNDGVTDVQDSAPFNAMICSDTDNDTCDDCSSGAFNVAGDGPDYDVDGQCDAGDADDDNDGVADGQDAFPFNAMACFDSDNDGCDDCSSGMVDAANDGADYDDDGLCDAGDPDDDNDGALDAADSDDNNANVCSDTDNDTCDDCSTGTFDLALDGVDFDADGLCDAGDPDDDNDGALDAADSDDNNANVCSDTDNDTCDDCSTGTFDLALDGFDYDVDGLCDAGDPDDDNDGALDAADSDDNNTNVCSDIDNDTCEDCSSGAFDAANDGLDFDGDGLCDAGDPDDDNDGVVDVLDPAPLDFDLCGDSDTDTCDDCSVGTDDFGPLSDSDPFNDGMDTDADGICDAGTSCPAGADIHIIAQKHTVGGGSNPGSTKEPLVGIEVCAYDSSQGSCARDECGGVSHREYTCIASGDGSAGPCDTAMCCTTGTDGECTIHVVPGDYLVISDDATKTVLPDPLGVSAGGLGCGDTKTKRLQQIVKANGKKVPGKTKRQTGSELLIIEPEFVVWEETQELYPFIFETVGDWTIAATVTPPEGFVADHDVLTADVDNELEAVQFVITEIGSDLVPTQTSFAITHGSRSMVVRSNVDLYLTPEYARSRGFVVRELRGKGLIREKDQIGREVRPDIDPAQKTASQRAWEAQRGQARATGGAAAGSSKVERERGRKQDR